MAQLGRKLTAKQQAIYDMRLAKRPVADVAAALDISPNVVAKQISVINQKLGIVKGIPKQLRADVESKASPEMIAATIDTITEPAALIKIKDAYKECGLSENVSEKLIKRLKAKYYSAITATRNLKASEIAELFSQKIDLAARYMDDKTAAEASFRDLALAASAMAEKRQLLRGEATVIVSDLERKKLLELLPLLITEGKRRGITVEGSATTVVVDNIPDKVDKA